MYPIVWSILAIILGFALLVWTADRFVIGASAIASNLGVSPLIIGLTIAGIGTSAPEMFVSGVAAWEGSSGLGIGNAIGSNITNIALILGVTAIITPLEVRSETLKREFPLLMLIMAVALLLVLDGELGRPDGVILLTGMAALIYWLVRIGLRTRWSDPIQQEYAAEPVRRMATWLALLWVTVGLVGLLISSRILVWGAVNIAQAMGISDLVIGLTVVAIGTSLPELAASMASALKKEHDIAIGNIIGSNMFNLLGVLALPGIILPGKLPDGLLTRDFPVMIALTVVLVFLAYGFRRPGHLSRTEGLALLASFFAYELYIFLTL